MYGVLRTDSVPISNSRFGLASTGSSGDSHVTISESSKLSVIKFLKLSPLNSHPRPNTPVHRLLANVRCLPWVDSMNA
jgi:hypothetical protein